MNNNISRKVIASLMLSAFVAANSLMTVVAMENAKPTLRDSGEYSLRLKGDVSFIKSKALTTISLRKSDVKEVLRMFADKAGMNIIFHDSVSGEVTLDLVDVPLNEAFDMVLGITDLNYTVDGNTIIVAKGGKEFNLAKQDMTLIPVKYVSASAIADFLNKNIYKMNKPGLSNSDIVTTNPATNELIIFGSKNDVAIAKKIIDKFDRKPTTTTFKVNHTTPAEMAQMICDVLIPAAGGGSTGGAAGIVTGGASSSSSSSGSSKSSSSSGSSGSSGGGGDSLTLNEGTVACTLDGKLDGEMSSLGLQNLAVTYYSQLGTVNIVGGSEHQVEMIKDFIAATDKKQPQAYLEVSILELNEEGSKEFHNAWSVTSDHFNAIFAAGSTDVALPISNEGKVFNWSGPIDVNYAISYLIQNNKARVVVNPRIIITNGVESTIEVTQDYIESTEVNVSTSTGGTVATRNYNVADDQGVTLSITPFISPDGYVTLNMTPEFSTEIGQVTAVQEVEGKDPIPYVAATLLSHRNLDLQNVRIKDGDTLVVAGMIQEHETKEVGKVPILGDIPVIGTLFRDTTTKKSKSEMVIMITPKIITDTEDAVTTDNL